MTTTTKVVFFIIVGLAVVLVASVLAAEKVGGYTLPTRGGVQVDIEVAAPPSLERWVREAVDEFNNRNSQITVHMVPLKGFEAEQKLSPLGGGALPDAWIVEADFVREMARGISYDEQGTSVAQTQLTWLAVKERGDLEGRLDWQTVHDLSSSDPQFAVAIPSPSNSVEGLAAYISAWADFRGQVDLRNSTVTDQQFLDWMDEILEAVPERTRSPVDQLARPPVSVDVGLVLESDLGQLDMDKFIRQAPQYNIIFNYPYVIRRDSFLEDAAAREKAAETFRDFLLSPEQQQKLDQFGFAPADDTSLGESVQIDGGTATALWNRVK
jgi:hypothetical protein